MSDDIKANLQENLTDFIAAFDSRAVTRPEVVCGLCGKPVEAHDNLGFCPDSPDKPAATGSGEPLCAKCNQPIRGHDLTGHRIELPTPPVSQPTVTPNDTDRLTWLTQTTAYVAWSRDGETCHLVWPYDPSDEEAECGPMQPDCYTTPREAIDVAMRDNMPNSLALLRAAEQK